MRKQEEGWFYHRGAAANSLLAAIESLQAIMSFETSDVTVA